MNKNIFQQHALVSKHDKQQQAGHKSVILWFTGLSGAGKSTLAHAVEKALFDIGCRTIVVDGDNVRHGICSDLGFSSEDRHENIRRVGELSKLFVEAGIITLTAFISPFQADRNRVRNLVNDDEFIEIYCNTNLQTCEQRDVKGLYAKARRGEIADFTGISSPYEPPVNPEIIVNTGIDSLEECVETIMHYLADRNYIKLT
jgi:adenylylsulfate kinase